MSVVAPFADIVADIVSESMAMLANVVVYPASGAPFAAEFNAADVDAFDGAAQAGDYTLNYQTSDASLAVGAVVTIRSVPYTVAAPPRRIGDGLESVAQLVEVAA